MDQSKELNTVPTPVKRIAQVTPDGQDERSKLYFAATPVKRNGEKRRETVRGGETRDEVAPKRTEAKTIFDPLFFDSS